jgi:ABC-2 type transport system permease protein
MSWWQGTRLVLGRELTVRVRSRSFIISSVFLLVVLGLVTVLPNLAGFNKYSVGVVSSTEQDGELIKAAAHATKVKITVHEYASETEARQAVQDGKVTIAVLDDGASVVAKKRVPDGLLPYVTPVLTAQLQEQELIKQKVDVKALAATIPTVSSLQSSKTNDQSKRLEGFIVMVMLMGQIVSFSTAVAQGVVEEKASRVIEVLVSTIRPAQLLVGKILGIGLAGLLQLLGVAVVGLGVGEATGAAHLDSTDFGVALQVLPWFVLAFLLFATLYAGAAATVSRQEDLSSALGPLSAILMATIFIGQLGITDADRPIVHILSYVPPFSPVLMVERWAGGLVGWSSVVVSMGLLAVGAGLIAMMASRIYLSRVLYFGAKVSLLKAFRTHASQ